MGGMIHWFGRIWRRPGPRPLPTLPAGYDGNAALAERKVGREQRNAAARRGAAEKVHQAYLNDRLLNEQVEL